MMHKKQIWLATSYKQLLIKYTNKLLRRGTYLLVPYLHVYMWVEHFVHKTVLNTILRFPLYQGWKGLCVYVHTVVLVSFDLCFFLTSKHVSTMSSLYK
jgi:hypothetical protein